MGLNLMDLWHHFFPPRISDARVREITEEVEKTTVVANRVADTFEHISQKAKERNVDPVAMLVHEVKGAKLRKMIREGRME